MDNQSDVTDHKSTPIPNPETQSISPAHLQKKSIPLLVLFFLLLLLTLSIGGIVLYFGKMRTRTVKTTPDKIPPSTTLPLSIAPSKKPIKKPNQFIYDRLHFTYPDNWLLMFQPQGEYELSFFFVRSDEDMKKITECAETNSCTSYPLKLDQILQLTIPQESTPQEALQRAELDIQLHALQKTTLNGYEAYAGFTNENNNTYQIVLITSQTVTILTASTTDTANGMLEALIATLSQSITLPEADGATVNKPEGGFAYHITVASKLQNSNIYPIIENILQPYNESKQYHYFLFTDTVDDPEKNIKEPAYPEHNPLNDAYYLLTDNDQLQRGVYGNFQIQIEISPSTIPNLHSYLADKKYCQQDSDCVYRSDFCTIGAFNQFHFYFIPWGCGPREIESIGFTNEIAERLSCQNNVDIIYDSLKCQEHVCQIINPQPVCEK